jgi:hypothetical protein
MPEITEAQCIQPGQYASTPSNPGPDYVIGPPPGSSSGPAGGSEWDAVASVEDAAYDDTSEYNVCDDGSGCRSATFIQADAAGYPQVAADAGLVESMQKLGSEQAVVAERGVQALSEGASAESESEVSVCCTCVFVCELLSGWWLDVKKVCVCVCVCMYVCMYVCESC